MHGKSYRCVDVTDVCSMQAKTSTEALSGLQL